MNNEVFIRLIFLLFRSDGICGWQIYNLPCVIVGRVAELVDAPDSKSGSRKGVGVQVPPCPPITYALIGFRGNHFTIKIWRSLARADSSLACDIRM